MDRCIRWCVLHVHIPSAKLTCTLRVKLMKSQGRWWLLEKPFEESSQLSSLLAAGVLGHSLGALRDGVLGQLTRQEEADCGLDLTTADGRLLVVLSKASRLRGDLLEDVVHERVHDAHGLAGDASLGVYLLQDLVDVD